MSNPPTRPATPELRQRLPTTNHGPAATQTREYQSDRASRPACRTATDPADHTPPTPTPSPKARNFVTPLLTTRSPYQLPTSAPGAASSASPSQDRSRPAARSNASRRFAASPERQSHELVNERHRSCRPDASESPTLHAHMPRQCRVHQHRRLRITRSPPPPIRAPRPQSGQPARLPLCCHSGHEPETSASGVMQPSAIGAGDDSCDRGRSRSSRALWRRAARQAAPGADDGSPTGCDSRAHGVAVTAGGPKFGPPYDGRLLTDDRRLAASRLPDGRNGKSVAATFAGSRSQAVERQPALVCQPH